MDAVVPYLLTFLALVAAVLGGYGTYRQIRPNSTKLVLEGHSTFIAAESGYFDRLTARLEGENLRLRDEQTRLWQRVAALEETENELGVVRVTVAKLTEERNAAVDRAAHAEQRVAELEAEIGQLRAEVAALRRRVDDATPPHGTPKPTL